MDPINNSNSITDSGTTASQTYDINELQVFSRDQLRKISQLCLSMESIPDLVIHVRDCFGKSTNKNFKNPTYLLPSMKLVDAINEVKRFMTLHKFDFLSYSECERTKKQVDCYVLDCVMPIMVYLRKDSHVICTTIRLAVLRWIVKDALENWFENSVEKSFRAQKVDNNWKFLMSSSKSSSERVISLNTEEEHRSQIQPQQTETFKTGMRKIVMREPSQHSMNEIELTRMEEIELAKSWFDVVELKIGQGSVMQKIRFLCDCAGQLKSLPQLYFDPDGSLMKREGFNVIIMNSVESFICSWAGKRLCKRSNFTSNPIIENVITGAPVPYHKFMLVGLINPFGYKMKQNDVVMIKDEIYVNNRIMNYNVVGLFLPDNLDSWLLRDEFREFKIVLCTQGIYYAPCTFNDLHILWQQLKSVNCTIVKRD